MNEKNKKDRNALESRKRDFDAFAKKRLARKDVLANILKYAVPEFQGYPLETIIACIHGDPEISSSLVDDPNFPPEIDAAGGESISLREGKRVFDIKFKVKTPVDKKETELIINVEAQGQKKPGYTMEMRAIYYLCRLVSSQYNVEFANSDFDSLKKVYSIWICLDGSKNAVDSITQYGFAKNDVYGHVEKDPCVYDLMSLVMINLSGRKESENELIDMLGALLVRPILGDAEEAKKKLKEAYQVTINEKEENDMCTLSEFFIEEGYERGRTEGETKGRAEGALRTAVETVKNLLEDHYPLDKALKAVKITRERYESYLKEHPEIGEND